MQIVIDIPEKVYNIIQGWDDKTLNWSEKLLKTAVPLPKGHGRLGDLDALEEEISSWGMNDYEPLDFIDAIDDAPTIIEADNEVEK